MTPLKDTLEATAPTTETAATQMNERKADAGQLRADAVSLDVPVKVHGSRTKEVVLGTTRHTEPFEEQTATLIVFPQGGVVRMSTEVTAGQMVVLTNLKSGHDAICRVVKVRACPRRKATSKSNSRTGSRDIGVCISPRTNRRWRSKSHLPRWPPLPMLRHRFPSRSKWNKRKRMPPPAVPGRLRPFSGRRPHRSRRFRRSLSP